MGLIVLTLLGAAAGWLATVILRTEDARGIGENTIVGAVGSVLAGVFAGNGTLFGGIGVAALLWAFVGAVIAIGALNLYRGRVAQTSSDQRSE